MTRETPERHPPAARADAGETPLVSVIIPCREDTHLPDTLRSLTTQRSAPSFEVVLVGTRDANLADRLSTWLSVLDLVVVVARGPATAGASRNTGVAAARGELLLFVDADDTVGDSYVRAIADALASHALVCGRIDLEALNPDVSVRTHPQSSGPITAEMGFLPFAGAGTLGVRRSVLEAIGGFDPSLPCYEEADLCWRLQLAGHEPPAFVPDAVLHYRVDPVPANRWRKALAFGRAQALLYRRYRSAGMPRESVRAAVRAWLRLMRGWLSVPRQGGIGWQTGVRIGRLEGSIRHWVPYL